MKQIFLTTLLLVAPALFAQEDFWEWQNPRPQGASLRDVTMLDSMTYFAVGDGGLVIKTTDDGATWDIKNLATRSSKPLYAVAFSKNRLHGAAVGDNGEIFFTTNTGASWAKAATPTVGVLLKDICFSDSLTAWVVGLNGTLIFSTDGGASWRRSPIELTEHLHSVTFTDAENGVVAARYGTFFTTENAGEDWVRREFPFGNSLYSVNMLNGREIIAGGEAGGVFLSNDSAKTWQQQQIGPSYPINGVVRLSKDRALAVSDYYGLYLTTNGGLTWEDKLTDMRRDHLKAIAFSDAQQGVCVGFNGMILRTKDGGNSWYAIFEKVAEFETLRAVHCFDANKAVALGSVILRTTNAGKKWTAVTNPTERMILEVDFPDNVTGYGICDSGVVIKSSDQGQTWNEIPIPFKTQAIDVNYLDVDRGIILADNNTIAITTNAGNSWFVRNIETPAQLYGIAYLSPTTLVAAGTESFPLVDSGRVLRSTDGGMTWTKVDVDLQLMIISCMEFVDSLNGYIGGFAGFGFEAFPMIAYTNDGGKTWTMGSNDADENISNPIYSISAADRLRATAVGGNGISLHTDDGGKNWKTIETGTRGRIWGVHHPDVTTATAVGFRALIMRLTTFDAPLAVNDPVASSAENILTSIYPNPAQYLTTMLLDLPQADVVTIELLSIEGKLLRTFYRGLAAQGTQQLDADLKGLASGAYLVSVRTSRDIEYHRLLIQH